MKLLARFKKSGLARDTMHLSIGQGLKLGIQAAYFVLIARSLGLSAYGAFVAVVALAAVFAPFSGMGAPNLFIKNVRSGKREAALCWGNGLLLVTLSGTAMTFLLTAANSLLHLRNSWLVVFLVCVSDLVFMKITELAGFGLAATDRMKDGPLQTAVISLLRLLGIVVLVLTLHTVTLGQWVWAYLITSILGAIYSIYRSTLFWGAPKFELSSLREDIVEGIFFSISTSATSIYNDVDKIMLGRLSDFVSNGIYSAAYRIIDVSMTPVRSLIAAAYAPFFKIGVGGVRATYPYARKLMYKSSMYGAAIFVGLWIFAPFLPTILGKQYVAAVPALRWLALIPFLRCFHAFLADSLSGAGFQRTRTAIQVLVGLLNIGLNFVILPRYSWRGAAWTSLGCDATLVIVFWLTTIYLVRRQPAPEVQSV